jgi:uncharacterized integral membrane protein (TIGR00698 family)
MKAAGFLLCIFIAAVTIFLSIIHPIFDPLTISIIAGILLGNILVKNSDLNSGISLALKIFLPLGIFLYGSQLILDWQKTQCCAAVVVIPLILFFLITLLLAKLAKLDSNTGILLATGISICGASAIAIVSPVIKAKKNEISVAVVATMVIGIIAIIMYPVLRGIFNFSPENYAFLVGSSVPMIGQVKITAGPDLYSAALSIKLLRLGFLAFLIPLIILFRKDSNKKIYFPWFVVGFIGLAIAFNSIPELSHMRHYLAPVSAFSLSAALAAIGLDVDLESATIEGLKPLLVLLTSWLFVVFLILMYFAYV